MDTGEKDPESSESDKTLTSDQTDADQTQEESGDTFAEFQPLDSDSWNDALDAEERRRTEGGAVESASTAKPEDSDVSSEKRAPFVLDTSGMVGSSKKKKGVKAKQGGAGAGINAGELSFGESNKTYREEREEARSGTTGAQSSSATQGKGASKSRPGRREEWPALEAPKGYVIPKITDKEKSEKPKDKGKSEKSPADSEKATKSDSGRATTSGLPGQWYWCQRWGA